MSAPTATACAAPFGVLSLSLPALAVPALCPLPGTVAAFRGRPRGRGGTYAGAVKERWLIAQDPFAAAGSNMADRYSVTREHHA